MMDGAGLEWRPGTWLCRNCGKEGSLHYNANRELVGCP